jgi:cytochrome P450
MSVWFNLYSFDVMGDLAFGKSYNMLESGEMHWSLKLLSEGMDPLGFNFPIWFFRVLIAIPGAATGFFKFIDYCGQQLNERMKIDKMENPDIMATLLDHHRKNPAQERAAELTMLQGDSRLIIVAGSDTTAATLVHLFYHLAKDPSLVHNLREELNPLIEKDGSVHQSKIVDAKLLNGVINETLRLHPPVPSGVFRETPREGIHIKDAFIPGCTTVRMPQWAMARGKMHNFRNLSPQLTTVHR